MRPLRAPLWFHLALVALAGATAHALGLHAIEPRAVQLAFWGWIALIAEAVWTAVQAVGEVSLAFLSWSVNALWVFAKLVFNGLIGLGKEALRGFNRAWGFLQELYEHVLKPAWLKFWRLVDLVRDTLARVLGPIIDFLVAVRRELLALYDRFVRPVLDTIELVRRVLRVAADLGAEWAKALDAQLARLEDAIDRPFRFLLRKLNEVINLVDRVIAANGLFQRLVLIRSIARDMRYIGNLWWHTFHRKLTPQEEEIDNQQPKPRTVTDVLPPLREYLETGGGPDAPRIDEAVADLAIRFRPGA